MHLVTSLVRRILVDMYKLSIVIIRVIRYYEPTQIPTAILNACLVSKGVIQEFKEDKFK